MVRTCRISWRRATASPRGGCRLTRRTARSLCGSWTVSRASAGARRSRRARCVPIRCTMPGCTRSAATTDAWHGRMKARSACSCTTSPCGARRCASPPPTAPRCASPSSRLRPKMVRGGYASRPRPARARDSSRLARPPPSSRRLPRSTAPRPNSTARRRSRSSVRARRRFPPPATRWTSRPACSANTSPPRPTSRPFPMRRPRPSRRSSRSAWTDRSSASRRSSSSSTRIPRSSISATTGSRSTAPCCARLCARCAT